MRVDVVLCTCMLAIVAVAPAAPAQDSRPPQGRAERPVRPSREVVGLRVVLGSTADDNGRIENDVRPPQFRGVQVSSVAQAGLSVVPLQRERIQLKFDGSSGVQHYASLSRTLATGHSATGVLSFRLDRGTSISLSQSMTYAPNFSLDGSYAPADEIAGPPLPDDPNALPAFVFTDVSVSRNPATILFSSIGINRTLGSRATLAIGADLKQTEFKDGTAPSVDAADARGMLTYRLFGGLGLRAGYGQRLGLFGASAPSRRMTIQDATFGLDFSRSRAISIGERAVLAFSTGSSIVSDGDRRQYVVTGTSTLNYALPGGITARLGYDRNVRLLGGFTSPVLVDTANLGLGARIGTRVTLTSGVSYAHGRLNMRGSADTDYNVWTGAAQASVSLAGTAGLYVAYSHYEQRSGSLAQIVGRIARTQRRDTLRAGLTIGVPVIRHQLRPRRQ